MVKLSDAWADKLNLRSLIAKKDQGQLTGKAKRYMVRWSHPDYPKGEKQTEKQFHTLEEAKEYGVWVAKNYDLRREGKDETSLDVRTGYNSIPEPSSNVPVAVETPFGLYELNEFEVFGTNSKSWTLIDELLKEGHVDKVEDNFRAG